MKPSWYDAIIESLVVIPTDDPVIMSERAFSIRGWLNFALGVVITLLVQRVRRSS